MLGTAALFTPHLTIVSGALHGCTGGANLCGSQCTNEGRYCAYDPEHDLSVGLDGADVVKENIRQDCVWRVVNATSQQYRWWSYVNGFQTSCSGSKATWTQDCARQVLQQSGINVNLVETCVTNSGSVINGTNAVLEQILADQQEYGIFLLPQVLINKATYHGSYSCPNDPPDFSKCAVFQAICSGFLDSTEPIVCKTSLGCELGTTRDECGTCGGTGNCVTVVSSSSLKVGAIVAIVIVSLAVVGAGVYIYIRRQSRIMREDIDSILKQYLPLEGQQQPHGDPIVQQRLINAVDDQ